MKKQIRFKQIRFKYAGYWTQFYDIDKVPKEMYSKDLKAVELHEEMTYAEYKDYMRKMEEE